MNLSSFSLNTELQPVIVRWRALTSDPGTHPQAALNALKHAAQEWPGRDLLLLAEDTELAQSSIELLRALDCRAQLDIVSVTGHSAAASLLAAQPAADLVGLFWHYGAHAALPCRHINWHCSLWFDHSLTRLGDGSADFDPTVFRTAVLGCALSDAGGDSIPASQNPALQHLHSSISHAADRGLPLARGTPQPGRVVLHILHSWGGGIETFVRQQAAADPLTTHLVLVAAGSWQSRQYGQRLFLYADLDAQPLCQWRLRNAINSTATSHAEYQSILSAVVSEWAVAEIRVSSLIGHSLDVLRTSTPTILCSHDLYPLWPVLHEPTAITELDIGQLQSHIDAQSDQFRFVESQVEFWSKLSEALCDELISRHIPIIHPSLSIRRCWETLQPKFAQAKWQQIAHARPSFTTAVQPALRVRNEPIRVIVPGRIAGSKGEALLRELIPQLGNSVRWLLLGCGTSADAFRSFDQVDTVAEYTPEQLPSLLEQFHPHLALLPSMAAESWGYVLSEMLVLEVPIAAVASGAYAERLAANNSTIPAALLPPDAASIANYLRDVLAGKANVHPADPKLAGLEPVEHVRQWQAIHRSSPGMPTFRAADDEETYDRLCRAETLQMIYASAHAGRNLQRLYAQADEHAQQLIDQRQKLLGGFGELLEIISKSCDSQFGAALNIEHEADIGPQIELAGDLLRMQKRNAELVAANLQATRNELTALQTDKRELQQELEVAKSEQDSIRAQINVVQSHVDDLQSRLAESYRFYETDVSDLARQRDVAVSQRDSLSTQLASAQTKLNRPFVRTYTALLDRSRDSLLAIRYRLHRIRLLIARGLQSLRSRGFTETFKRVKQTLLQRQQGTHADAQSIDIRLAFTQPDPVLASIIIPVFNNLSLTMGCLESLLASQDETPFEVIVVDDASTDASGTVLPRIDGLRYLKNKHNAGFIASCNAGAAIAQGRYLVFLNNDTCVRPGWLDQLLMTFHQHPDTGLAGSKLIYADGRLQESGGIVFSDGSGWNYGRFEDPDHPMYNFVREVDYCSGAAIAIARSVFEALDGFDAHYAPAYYEDTDLAMKVRSHGLKVRVQPASEVIHFEGASSGTDLSQGTKSFQVINQKKFRERWSKTLRKHPEPGSDVIYARNHRARMNVLVIDACTPMPDRDSGSLRMFEILRLLCKEGCAVSFFAENGHWDGEYSRRLQDMGVEVWSQPHLGSIPDWLKQHGKRFQTILVSRHYVLSPLLPLIKAYAPKAKIIFDTVDLHYLREEREAAQKNDPALIARAKDSKRSELSLMREVDVTWVVSPVEKALLADEVATAHIEIMSNIHHVRGLGPGFEERHDVVFVGGYRHPPNVDAVLWFATEIWPIIYAADPGIGLHLAGSDAPESVIELHGKNGIVVHGYVADLIPLLDKCRVSIAPLRYGAGVKGKINQALSLGLPVVGTHCAVEGMGLRDEQDVLIADNASDFAARVLRLHQDPVLWKTLAEAGLLNTAEKFSDDVARRALLDTFKVLMS